MTRLEQLDESIKLSLENLAHNCKLVCPEDKCEYNSHAYEFIKRKVKNSFDIFNYEAFYNKQRDLAENFKINWTKSIGFNSQQTKNERETKGNPLSQTDEIVRVLDNKSADSYVHPRLDFDVTKELGEHEFNWYRFGDNDGK